MLIGYEDFVDVATQRILSRDPLEEIRRAFGLFDEEGKGGISVADLRRVAKELGEGLEEEEIRAMIEEFDLDGDGMSKYHILPPSLFLQNYIQYPSLSLLQISTVFFVLYRSLDKYLKLKASH